MGWLGIEGQVLRAEPGQAACTDAVGLRWALLVFKGTVPHAASLEIAVSQQGRREGYLGLAGGHTRAWRCQGLQ